MAEQDHLADAPDGGDVHPRGEVAAETEPRTRTRRRRSSSGSSSSGREGRSKPRSWIALLTLENSRNTLATIVFLAALLFGGVSGAPAMVAIELLSVASIALGIASFSREQWRDSWPAWLVAALVLVVGVIELVPLSYKVWTGLPGREVAKSVMDAAGLVQPAHSLSLDPHMTMGTLLATLPGIACFLAALTTDRRTTGRWTTITIGAAFLCALMGAAQVSGGQLYLYPDTHYGYVVGLFANHNHVADLFLIGIVLLAAKIRRFDRRTEASVRTLLLAGLGVLVMAQIATGSRTGIAFLMPAVVAAFLIYSGRNAKRAWLGVLALLAAAAGIYALVTLNPVLNHAISRFETVSEDVRYTFWGNSVVAIKQFWPLGSGLGTFVPVYASVEPLDAVAPYFANHAHNEYLELLLELGVLGLMPPLVAIGFVIRAFLKPETMVKPERAAALFGILLLLAHSIVDYPLRMPALMVVFAVLGGIALSPTRKSPSDNEAKE